MEQKKKKYCDYCGKPIGEPGEIYIAGSICPGTHYLNPLEYIFFKIKKLFKSEKRNINKS